MIFLLKFYMTFDNAAQVRKQRVATVQRKVKVNVFTDKRVILLPITEKSQCAGIKK